MTWLVLVLFLAALGWGVVELAGVLVGVWRRASAQRQDGGPPSDQVRL